MAASVQDETQVSGQEAPGENQAPYLDLLVRSYGMSHTGLVRKANEDQFLIAGMKKALEVRQSSLPQSEVRYSDEEGTLFVVADGMGGHQAGEEASALAIKTIEEFVLNALKWFSHLQSSEGNHVLKEFQAALQRADARIFEEAASRPELRGMGTTLTMAYCLDSTLFVLHVGDSRCYLLRQDHLYKLTHDHTLVEEMVRHGQLSPEEASHHRFRHVITNAVGGTEPGIRVEAHKIELEPADRILLCSDGLTEMLKDDEIRTVLQEEPDERRACERLINRANEMGGRDNITVVVAGFQLPAPAA